MITVYTGGTFDLFHAGHVNFLKEAKALGDWLIVALNRDEFVSRFKRAPICSFLERYYVLKSCRYVDIVITNHKDEYSGAAIDIARPDIIAIGDDWKDRNYLGQLGIDQKFLDDRNIELKYIPYFKGISSTEIIRRINESSNSNIS
jgi:glycerol-3-phosphate cytidylyltransferase